MPAGTGSWHCDGYYSIAFSQVLSINTVEDMAVGDGYYLNNACIRLGYLTELSTNNLCVFRTYFDIGSPAGIYTAIGY